MSQVVAAGGGLEGINQPPDGRAAHRGPTQEHQSAKIPAALSQRGKDELDPLEFEDFVREKMKLLDMNPDFLDRGVNEGFSGGEKKRNEILQMALLEPRLAILDETDSGLDIDALRIVTGGVNKLATKDNAIILVTHYQRMLNYIVPDYVHVMQGGRIIKTGGKELALDLETRGYDWVGAEQRAAIEA
jgi:Fe-S cluster assembly ATP-binding protein